MSTGMPCKTQSREHEALQSDETLALADSSYRPFLLKHNAKSSILVLSTCSLPSDQPIESHDANCDIRLLPSEVFMRSDCKQSRSTVDCKMATIQD
jgi:hypothetical protein